MNFRGIMFSKWKVFFQSCQKRLNQKSKMGINAKLLLSALFCGGCLFAKAAADSADVVMRPDGEISTISAALEKVRVMRASGVIAPDRPAVVRIESGRYAVKDAAVFKPVDSSIRFVAAEKGRAVFDGGVTLPQFKVGADGVWRTRVPDGLDFEQLFVNGRRAQRARTPNKHCFHMAMPWEERRNPKTGAAGDFSRRAFFAERPDIADIAKLPHDELARVEMQLWQSWDMARMRVEWLDGESGAVLLSDGASRPLFFFSYMTPLPRYAIENCRAALDAPGEWFLDAKARELLYIPLPGERPETTRAVAPAAMGFLVFAADPRKGETVHDISFSGIVFKHSAWILPPNGARNSQSAANFGDAAILADGAERLSFDNCRLSHIGLHGIWLRRGCRGCRVSHCCLEDLGGGGVYLGGRDDWRKDAPDLLTAFNVVTDSIIRGGGRILNGAVGVWIGHASDNEISHNDIGDFLYTGVSLGWTWGYAPAVTKRNRLLWNRIHHVGRGVLADMGGVYTLGDCEGTVVAGNWIHDVDGYAETSAPAVGIYTDEGSSGILHASNLIERCSSGAVFQHFGRENVFANNIFSFDRYGIRRGRIEDHTTVIVTNNIFWRTSPAAQAIDGKREDKFADAVFDSNLYCCTDGVPSHVFGGRTWGEWRAGGHDLHSSIADPKFRNPAGGDWHLDSGSPALGVGFVPWDWTFAGVLKDSPRWRAAAMDDSRIAPIEGVPRISSFFPTSCREDFEKLPLGPIKNLGRFVTGGAEGLSITDKTSASGGRSLCLTDSAVNTARWQPHIYTRVRCDSGAVRIRFAFKTDGKSRPAFELRDYHPTDGAEFASGPKLTFEKGVVCAAGREIARVPIGVWCRVEVFLRVTGEQAGTWRCTVIPHGGAPVTADGLKAAAAFRALEWAGFMTNGTDPASWHLDDFSIEPES